MNMLIGKIPKITINRELFSRAIELFKIYAHAQSLGIIFYMFIVDRGAQIATKRSLFTRRIYIRSLPAPGGHQQCHFAFKLKVPVRGRVPISADRCESQLVRIP